MTVRFTDQNCKVETTCVIQPNGVWWEHIVLSVDPACPLSLAIEERAGQSLAPRVEPKAMRVRATRHGFELVERR